MKSFDGRRLILISSERQRKRKEKERKKESLVREFESQPGALFLKVWVVASSEEFCLLFVALTSKSRYKLI